MNSLATIIVCNALLLLPAVPAASGGDAGDDLTGREIIEKYLANLEVDSEMAYIAMEVTASGQKVRENRFLTLFRRSAEDAREYFIRLVLPEEVEGVTVLTRESGSESEQFVYLPAVGRMQKLTEDSRKGSFLGSDFTYEDLMLELPGTFEYERRADAKPSGIDSHVVRARGSEEGGDSAYAYRDLYIAKDSHNLVKIDFYDEREKLVKMMTAYEYDSDKVKGETKRPRRAVMLNPGKGTSTTFTVIESRLDEDFDPALFTPEKLENWPPEEVEELVFQMGMTVTAE